MADPIEVGSVLTGTYQITRLLGRGGMGAVWEATHLRLPGKRVAIKVLLGERVSDPNVYARFRREAEIASRLGHPSIIEALDFNTLPDGAPYIVLEYLEGETLAARIKKGPISLEDTFSIVRQIGSALAAAHRAGVVHRDLKPDNIFLLPTDAGGEVTDRVKILDFGISKIRDSQSIVTTDQTVLGTPQYMSPEQASAKHGEVDARTDQFALGAIVYEMLSGQAAFAGPTLVSVVYKVMAEHPEPLPKVRPQVPARVGAAVERALSKKPENRYPDIAAFVEDLTGRPLATLGGARASDMNAGAAAAPKKSGAPKAAVLFAAGAFVVAVALMTALALHQPSVSDGTGAPQQPKATRIDKMRIPAASELTANPMAIPSTPPVQPNPDLSTQAAAPQNPINIQPDKQKLVEAPAANPDRTKPEIKKLDAGGKPKSESLPPEVVADLEQAEGALGSNPSEAIRVARRTLSAKASARAYSIIARGFCKQGNLGDAKAQMSHVGGERGRVVRECKAAGIDL